jgi:hypothetical protein
MKMPPFCSWSRTGRSRVRREDSGAQEPRHARESTAKIPERGVSDMMFGDRHGAVSVSTDLRWH